MLYARDWHNNIMLITFYRKHVLNVSIVRIYRHTYYSRNTAKNDWVRYDVSECFIIRLPIAHMHLHTVESIGILWKENCAHNYHKLIITG